MAARIPRAMTIAGSDSGGGAGIQADLKTFSALGVFGTTAITALTAQNTRGVTAVVDLPPAFIGAQIDAIVTDIGVDAAKTGMLSNAEIIEIVAHKVREHHIDQLVVDPVMVAKSGAVLLRPEAMNALRQLLLPLALVVTPNLPEASALIGSPITTEAEMEAAARAIVAMGPRAVVIKGGHRLASDQAVDILYDGRTFQRYPARRVQSTHTHGTGCIFAAAITAGLAQGRDMASAVRQAKLVVTAAIEGGLPLGGGHGPANPMAILEGSQPAESASERSIRRRLGRRRP